MTSRSRFGTIPLSPGTANVSSRAVDKCLDDAQDTGELILSGRQLKECPRNTSKYVLSYVLTVDLSRNRLFEFPQQLESMSSLESLNMSHNILRSLSPSIDRLTSLVCLNLNRNLLTTLPSSLCNLVNLEMLLLNNNKLVSVPEEICRLQKLMQLDVSCNQLSHLPPQLGQLSSLRSLNLRQNLLVELPPSLSLLNLKMLDFSSNRVAKIPVEFGWMNTLEVLLLDKNPLVSPPANVCSKGLVHVLKILYSEAAKDEKRKSYMLTHANSPRVPNRRFAGSTNSLTLERGPTPSLTSSSSFSSLTPQSSSSSSASCNNNNSNNINALLPPQPLNRANHKQTTRSIKTSGNDHTGIYIRNGETTRHNRTSSCVNGTVHRTETPFLNGFSHYDSSTLGRHKLESYNSLSLIQNGSNHSVTIEGCQDEIDERRKAAVKLLDGVRKRRLSQGGESLSNTPNNNDTTTPLGRPEIGEGQTLVSRINSYHGVDQPDNDYQPNHGSRQHHHSVDSDSSMTGSCDNQQQMLYDNTTIMQHKNVLPLACRKALEAMTQELNDLEPGFTVRRTWKHAKVEEELVIKMKKVIETKLNMRLPSDLQGFLKDGVVLCRLVNHFFPDTIAHIHAPTQRLSGRLNVDNFLVSCQTVGLDKSYICSAPAILDKRNLAEVARTVLSLADLVQDRTSV